VSEEVTKQIENRVKIELLDIQIESTITHLTWLVSRKEVILSCLTTPAQAERTLIALEPHRAERDQDSSKDE
jgi:hypothetical protein